MKKIVGLFIVFNLFFTFNIHSDASGNLNEGNNSASITSSSSKNDAMKHVQEITKELENIHGSLENFEKIGGIYFDSNGTLNLNYKKSDFNMGTKTSTGLSNLLGDNSFIENQVDYSTLDLKTTSDEIEKEIQNFYTIEEYNNQSFVLLASFQRQKVILEHRDLSDELLKKIKEKYGDVFEATQSEAVSEATIAKKADWNMLGAGLGLKNKDGGICTSAGVASRNGVYFILTAGHCFKGTTSTTGGDLFKQYNANVGRQHQLGTGSALDVGLIRVTSDNTLTGGRYATNKIRRWANSSDFDGSLSGWTTMYDGVSVCKSGVTTDVTCGTVSNANTTVKYEGYPTFNVSYITGANFTDSGDSGGAAYHETGGKIYLTGIVSGKKTAADGKIVGGYVTHYRDIQNLYGITLFTSGTNYKITD